MHNLKMYSEEEQFKGIMKYSRGIYIEVNDDERADIPCGAEVTIIGEFTMWATHDTCELEQYIFTYNNTVFSCAKEFVEELPKEKLEQDDFLRIDWYSGNTNYMRVVHDVRNGGGYSLKDISSDEWAFSGNKTLAKLLERIKESGVVVKYEILPKSEYKTMQVLTRK